MMSVIACPRILIYACRLGNCSHTHLTPDSAERLNMTNGKLTDLNTKNTV